MLSMLNVAVMISQPMQWPLQQLSRTARPHIDGSENGEMLTAAYFEERAERATSRQTTESRKLSSTVRGCEVGP